jgi:type III secretory pathway component EscT
MSQTNDLLSSERTPWPIKLPQNHHCPWWTQGALAPLVALLLNLYAWIDIIAVVPTLMDLAYKRDACLRLSQCNAKRKVMKSGGIPVIPT